LRNQHDTSEKDGKGTKVNLLYQQGPLGSQAMLPKIGESSIDNGNYD